MPYNIKQISIGEVEFLAHDLAREMMVWNEPIPDFNTRPPNALEGSLAAPFQTFGKKDLYKGLVAKAAILFYLMIKNHPFQNGNKRIAITVLFVFLYKNGKWMHVDNVTFYNFANWVAASDPKVKRQVVSAIDEFIKSYIVNL